MHTFKDILGQQAAIDVIRRAYLAERLPHGLIFAGPAGVGKGTAAAALGKLFLCERPRGDEPCGKCDSCRVFDAGNHPDYHVIYRQLVRLEKESSKAKELPVSVIRQFLVAPANLKAIMGRGKFFVVEEAELMNAAAQNSMLKTLEEPAGRTAIVLLTDQPAALLPTIRSRCQALRFAQLEPKLVLAELRKRGVDAATAADAARFADGSLGVALKWIGDGVVDSARELSGQLEDLLGRGQPPENLPGWFRSAAEAYAEKQLERDELASKDQATREGLSLYLRVAANHFRQALATADPPGQERACAAIEAIVRAENYLDANVNVPIIFQQLAMALGREYQSA